jgi:putative ABC transport system permease protein
MVASWKTRFLLRECLSKEMQLHLPGRKKMAKRALSWKRAASIGWRDLRSAPAKFGFVILSVAVGVAALVGVRGLSNSFRQTLSTEARSLMAADLSARLFHEPTQEEKDKLAAIEQQSARDMRFTWVTETVSMASAPPEPAPLLVSLKAVDPAEYPFYGHAELEPAMDLKQALDGDSVVVAEELLIRLNAHVGQSLRLGGRNFRIAAVLKQEPDRLTASTGLGPRVMISRSSLEATGLLAAGSRASRRLLIKLLSQIDPVAARHQIESALPDAQVMDYREGNPGLNRGLENATAILSLICLVAMVLGAIGVAMAMHAHLERRMNMLAVLKAVGADSAGLLRIFLLQTLGLGLAGGVLGVLAGIGVMIALPSVLGRLLPIHAQFVFPWRPAAVGLGTGLLTTLLFCLPPLLDVRKVRPVLVLRRLVEHPPDGISGWLAKWWARRLQLVFSAIVVLALGVIAWGLTESAKVGGWFAFLLAAALVVLLALAAIMLRLLRLLLNRTRLYLPSWLRQGLANLYRPGNQSAAVLAALGTGIMLILTVFLMQSALLRDLREIASPRLPNFFLIDVSTDEVEGVKEFFQHQSGMRQALDLMPWVAGKVVSINGQRLDQLRDRHFPRHMLEDAGMSWADAPPAGDAVRQGNWWTSASADELAVNEGVAGRMGLGVGATVGLEIGGVVKTLKVAAIYRSDGQHMGARVNFVLPSGQLKDVPATWYGSARVDPARIPALERALFVAYPTISVINLADVLGRIESVVDQITFVVRFLAGFSIFAGLAILAASIAGTRYRRMREAVVLKTLGATRMRIVRTFSVEFSVLGLLAGTVGVIFANLLTSVLLHKLEVGYRIEWVATLEALVGTALLAMLTGWIASYRILGLRPLEVLREE